MRWKGRRSGFVVTLSSIVNVKRLRFCISILYKLQYMNFNWSVQYMKHIRYPWI
jgi:hypothetical protein